MTFICPECNSDSLKIKKSHELGPDKYSDERAIQTLKCLKCKFKSISLYEESRRGAMDSESVHHCGYYAPDKKIKELKRAIRWHKKIDIDYFIRPDKEHDTYKWFNIELRKG